MYIANPEYAGKPDRIMPKTISRDSSKEKPSETTKGHPYGMMV